MKRYLFAWMVLALVSLSACAHSGDNRPEAEPGRTAAQPGMRIESPYAEADISINGEKMGRTPLEIPWSRLDQRQLRLTAVAVADHNYRRELVFELPPFPRKVTILSFDADSGAASPAAPAEAAPAAADAGEGGPRPVEKTDCPDQTIPTPIVFFDTDKSDLLPQGREDLRAFGERMKHNRHVMDIVGYADERHTAEYNIGLSLRRAGAVYEFLKTQGISGDRMRIEGRGEIQSVDATGIKKQWDHNRRVEIRIVQ